MNSRRTFLSFALGAIVAFFLYFWNKLVLQHLAITNRKKQTIPFNKNKEVVFNDDFIIVNNNGTTTAFSAHCTHLGCKIDKMEGERFVCPCHGSQYDLNGKVLKGPAYKDLEIVPSEISEDGNNIIVGG